ncbi:hypothetical protein [Desulfonema magnum]|uniref:Uncharacterized protein n=1 Tax=Desulfonema magnum TaxID=45655 RepID=A0A975BH83_9BACT|nr:hypothetical protein [Desulfonema magnum]QTA85341.1 Uncharacterized protein dnm_013460 [Desulfonema magnum]
MQETIKLMADYECFPLWKCEETGAANVDTDSLPLSAKTKKRLRSWAECYDSTLNLEYPASSGFATKEDQQAFEEEGKSLCKILVEELKDTYKVVYFSESASELLEFQRENMNTERMGEASEFSKNFADTSDKKEETDMISSDVQKVYKQILKLTTPEKMILISKMLPELSREFEKNVNPGNYSLKDVGKEIWKNAG